MRLEEILLFILTIVTIGVITIYAIDVLFINNPKESNKVEYQKFQDGNMTKMIPNDRNKRLEFLREMHKTQE